MAFRIASSLYPELKEALGLPDNVISLSISMEPNKIPTLTVVCGVTTDQMAGMVEVMRRYRIEKITDEPQP